MSTPSSSSPSGSRRLWEAAWTEIQPTLTSLRSKIASWPRPTARITRVGQLDAELLDQELVMMLTGPVNKALGQLGVCQGVCEMRKHQDTNGSLCFKPVYETRYDPEIALIIGAILYKFSMWDKGATYGAKLQDLQYKAIRTSSSSMKLTREWMCIYATGAKSVT